MIGPKNRLAFAVALALSLGPHSSIGPIHFALSSFSNFSKSVAQFEAAAADSISAASKKLPASFTKPTPRSEASERKSEPPRSAPALPNASAPAPAASPAATPAAPSVAAPAPAPNSSLTGKKSPTIPSVTQPAPLQESNVFSPSADTSVGGRLSTLEKQITALKNFILSQSDHNISSVGQVAQSIVQVVKDTAAAGVNALVATTGTFSSDVSVGGALSLSAASTTASNGFSISAGCFSINGVCVGGGSGGGAGSMTFAFPFTKFGSDQSTTTLLDFFGGFQSTASSTIGAGTTATGLTIFGGATSTVSFLSLGSTTLQAFTASQGTIASATSTNLYTTNFLAQGSTTLQAFTASQGTIASATSTNLYFTNALASGSSTFQKLFSPSATATNLYATNFLANGSSTLLAFTATQGTITSATSTNLYFTNALASGSSSFQALFSPSATGTNLYATNFLALSSSTLQAFTASQGTITSATSTNLYATNFLASGSSSFQALFSPSATGTNLYSTNFLALGSSTLQAFTAIKGTITSGTTTDWYITNLNVSGSSTLQAFTAIKGTITSGTTTDWYITNLNVNGSTTLQNFTASLATTSQATSTNFFATTANFGNASTDVVNFKAGALNFLNRATTTLQVTDTAWVIATSSAAASSPLLSFNNSAGTSTIQFFGSTTTGLTAGTGMPIQSGNFVLIGDGHAPAGLNILKGGLCVDNDGWCAASTTGRISSVSSFIGNSDLAEMYQAGEYMEPGDVVAITSGISVMKAVPGAHDKMMGVISTKPGIVLGSGPDAEGRTGDVPVALTGRVPVKVTTENGVIHAGDYLTLSSQTGVAARASKAGTTIGQALEDYSGAGVAKILVFVKNSYYSGLSLDQFPGMTADTNSNPQAILAALESGATNHSSISSDLSADRMLAAVEIITPKLYAGLVSATTIESPTIDALSNRITTDRATLEAEIGSTNTALASLTTRVTALESASTTSLSLAAVTIAVHDALASAQEWVVGKVTAALGVFTRIEAGTVNISQGLEMTDTTTGTLYCITVKNNEWDKAPGPCVGSATSTPVVSDSGSGPVPEASSSPEVTPEPVAPAPDQTTATDTPPADTGN